MFIEEKRSCLCGKPATWLTRDGRYLCDEHSGLKRWQRKLLVIINSICRVVYPEEFFNGENEMDGKGESEI
jgi:hypothetical protein